METETPILPVEPQRMRVRFYISDLNQYKFLRLELKPSTIPNAGMGVFAVDKIPKGAVSPYKGVKKTMVKGNAFYSWIIYEYDPESGRAISNKELFLLDATNKNESNWTRYVNCGMKRRYNNMDCFQKFDKIYYFAKKDILPGKELFIDYGPEYRKVNLQLTGLY